MLNKELNDNYAIQFGVKPTVLRYIYENRLSISSLSFRSYYYISIPISLQKRLSQTTDYWNISGGLSLELFLGRHDNYFYYEYSGYVGDGDGNLVYTEEILMGKDAKKYNNTLYNQQNPISVSCQGSLIRHHQLNSGSAIEFGLNIQLMEVISFYNDNLFFTENAILNIIEL